MPLIVSLPAAPSMVLDPPSPVMVSETSEPTTFSIETSTSLAASPPVLTPVVRLTVTPTNRARIACRVVARSAIETVRTGTADKSIVPAAAGQCFRRGRAGDAVREGRTDNGFDIVQTIAGRVAARGRNTIEAKRDAGGGARVVDDVGAIAAIDRVGTEAAADRVVAIAAIEGVVAGPADDNVGSRKPVDDVGVAVAGQRVGEPGTVDVLEIAK